MAITLSNQNSLHRLQRTCVVGKSIA